MGACRISIVRGGLLASDFFRGIVVFSEKNELKSEIFNYKKIINKNVFSVITKNLNWEIFTKHLIIYF